MKMPISLLLETTDTDRSCVFKVFQVGVLIMTLCVYSIKQQNENMVNKKGDIFIYISRLSKQCISMIYMYINHLMCKNN